VAELEGSGQRGYISDRTVVVNVLCNNISCTWLASYMLFALAAGVDRASCLLKEQLDASHKNSVIPKKAVFLYRRCTALFHKIHNKENFNQCNYLLFQ